MAKQNPIIDEAVAIAKQLEFDKAAIHVKVDANRKLLRMLDANDMLDEPTGQWLDAFYPGRAKGSNRTEEDAKLTLQVKQAAREEVAAQRGVDVPEGDEAA